MMLDPIQRLIASLATLPGIGEKSATRLALYLINCPREKALELSHAIADAREKIRLCARCFNYAEQELCQICANPSRDGSVVCVVETPGDLLSIERTGWFRGTYHVLHGCIMPFDGIGPEQLHIAELCERIKKNPVAEVIIATNPTTHGNATAAYIADQLKESGIRVTRIAQGIAPGSDIGYADQITLKNALEGRRDMNR
ncbi:MAG: recombination mediator RecR [Desulfobacterota bacterium]|nr:recombination mediator RecR [Thermodesulfobacteriota bacterium]